MIAMAEQTTKNSEKEDIMIKVTIENETYEYPKGTTFEKIAIDMQHKYPQDIALVLIDNRLQELGKKLKRDCTVKMITTADEAGHKTYKRTATLVLLKALYSVAKAQGKALNKATIRYSLDKGVYCTVDGDVVADEVFLQEVKKKMFELVEAKMPVKKRSISTEAAIRRFKKYGMKDKEKLFRYRRVSRVNIYELDGFEDYFYGYMMPNAGYIKYFDLIPYNAGFVLQMPDVQDMRTVPKFNPPEKLFQVLKESREWSHKLGVNTVGALNDKIVAGELGELMLVQEALQEKKIADIAEEISQREGVKFIMIAGPSSSGKTTFSHRLSVQLIAHGMRPHPIAVDDYFKNRVDTPRDENGNYNFECIEALDAELFNRDMIALLKGERIELPRFNFKTGVREYKGDFKQLGKEDILVIEGIHCLNDKLSNALPKESKYKIYISALTQLNVDEHNRIPTTDGRLIRRMVRDARTRGADATTTIRMWKSVRKGEEQNIFPFQEDADAMFNSALVYELSVLKQYAEPLLFSVKKEDPEYVEAKRLLKFLDYFLGASTEDIPQNSILREFVGGSCFHV